MALDATDTRSVDALVRDARQTFGERLAAVALYGEAATDAYRPGRSPLHAVLLLDRVNPTDLRALRSRVRGLFRRPLATPLLIDPSYLVTSRDVFPLELLEFRDRHRLVDGTTDPFAALDAPNPPHLRLAIEQQVKGKLLHLRESYLLLGYGRRGLDELLAAVRDTLDVVLRGVLALADRPRPVRLHDVLAAVEVLYDVPLPGFTRLERWHAGGEQLAGAALDPLFDAVHEELAALAARVDRR